MLGYWHRSEREYDPIFYGKESRRLSASCWTTLWKGPLRQVMKLKSAHRGICLKVRSSSRSKFRLPWDLWLCASSSNTTRIPGTQSCWMSWSERRMWGSSTWKSWPSSSVLLVFSTFKNERIQQKNRPNGRPKFKTSNWSFKISPCRHHGVDPNWTPKTCQAITPPTTWPKNHSREFCG